MRFITRISFIILLITKLSAVGTAGAIFLLIAPGAGPAGTGEAQVAKVDDAYASFYNPSGLAFLEGKEISLMHVNWLPNLADDLFYDFLSYRHHVPQLGSFGGNFIILSLGEQAEMDEQGNYLGTFRSYMWALTGSFGTKISESSSIGVSAKIFNQKLFKKGVAGEGGSGTSTDFAMDLGYLVKFNKFNFGTSITNIGPPIHFIDEEQADPAPTNLKMGVNIELYNDEFNKLNFLFDMNKLLVASYPSMDWDGNGIIGGYDDIGHESPGASFNIDGDEEMYHSDPWYLALVTSWLDDWYYGGDVDFDSDDIIGGYEFEDINGNGVYDKDTEDIWEETNGVYNTEGIKELGSGDDRTVSTEFTESTYNLGLEYWYTEYFAIRAGFIYDQEGDIKVPTFGAGVRFSGYGVDFGYTAGEQGHPRSNTMFFSVNLEF
jgi:hypothetical protein